MSPASYGICVALHASALSIAGVAGVALMRRPQARATAILILLLILSVAPWVLPVLRNRAPVVAVAKPSAAAREVPEQRGPAIVRLPVWTIASLPVESESSILPPIDPPKDAASPVATVKPAISAPAPFSAYRLYVSAAWLWLAGSAVGIVWLLGSGLRLGLWLRRLPGLSDEQWLLIRRHLGGAEIPRSVFRIAADGRGPCVGGMFRPRIVLPLSMLGEKALTRQLRWTLSHESCHWNHGDSRWVWAVALTRSLYWWNPIVHLLAGRWTASREQVCDLEAGESERNGYSSFLVAMASRASRAGGGLAVTMVRRQRSRSLRRRIVALLNASPGDLLPAGRGFKLAMAGGLGALAVVLSGITIAEDAKPAGRATVQEETQENEKDEEVWEPPAAEIPLPPAPALRGDANRFSKLNFAVIYSNHDIAGGQRVIPAAEYEAFRSKIYSDPSNVVAAAFPAIAIRENGEEGRMEFIREVVRPKQKEAGKKILGWQINPAVLRENDRITLTMKATYGYAAGHAFGTPDPQQIRWPDPLDAIASASGESSAVVGPDDILVTSLGMLEKDCYVTVFTRALEIDATGRPITASPLPPEQELTEKVRLTGEISTFPLSKHQKAYLAEVKGLLLQPSESMDRAVLLADSRDGDLPAGVPFHPSGQPCIAAIIPPSSWKPFSGATGAKEALGPVEVVSGKRLKPWKQLDLELTVRLQRTFLGDELTLQLKPETFDVKWPGVPGQVWVIELRPLKAGTRRLLTLTAEKVQ